MVQHGGKELSYLNIFDADAAWRLVHELAADRGTDQAVAIIKHANPCGAALHPDLAVAYERALECDPQSAFGGIVAIGGPVTPAVAEAIAAGPQADVIIAPSYDEDALAQLTSKRKATRLLSAPAPEPLVRQFRGLGASVLVQDADRFLVDPSDLGGGHQGPAHRGPVAGPGPGLEGLRPHHLQRHRHRHRRPGRRGRGRPAVAGGGGRDRRGQGRARAAGGAAASDAFFPFPDGLLVLADAGVAAVVQPGGSIRDGEVVAAADEAGIAVVMAGGERHFRH